MADDQNPKPSLPKAETAEEFRYLQQIYQSQYMVITQEINTTIDYIRQLDAAQRTLERAPEVNGKNSLVPLGADTYMSGKITGLSTVIMGVGAGYLVEKNLDDAKKLVSSRSESEMKAVNKLMANKAELENALINISYKIDEISH